MDSLPWKTWKIRKVVEAGSGGLEGGVGVTLMRRSFPLTLPLQGKDSWALSSKVFFFFFFQLVDNSQLTFVSEALWMFIIMQNVNQNAYQEIGL